MIELTGRLTMTVEQIVAFGRLTEAAASGDWAAACRLGDMYREALGGLRYSPKLTFHWYSRSALAGDANGQNNLGACYEHGLGCEQSYAKAVKWYRLSAAQGLSTAYMNLGYCYLHGHGVPEDKDEALWQFQEAVARGEDGAEKEVERLGVKLSKSRIRVVDQTEAGQHFGLVGVGGIEPPAEKTHVPRDRESIFSFYVLQGREPEAFDADTEPRYRAYLAKEGVTKKILERNREYSDLAMRAWEKDDCFGSPVPGSLEAQMVERRVARFWQRHAAGEIPAMGSKLAGMDPETLERLYFAMYVKHGVTPEEVTPGDRAERYRAYIASEQKDAG